VGPSEGGHSTRTWSAQLLVEALDRALALARLQDAERILRRATAQVEEMVASGGQVDFASLGALATRAAATTLATDDPTWALWVLDIYRRIGGVPPGEFVERLAEVATRHRPLVLGAVTSLLEHLGSRGGPSQRSMEALMRLEQVRGLLSEGTTEESGVSPSPRQRSR
jgi:hypothetical protein